MHTVTVALGARSYPILIGARLLPQLGPACRRLALGPRCAVITDSHVGPRYALRTLRSLRQSGFDPALITVPAGEPSKRLATVARCCNTLAAHRLERRSFVVALGGGVVGDLAGFVAASYLRGIDFVQVPTTLLAQVDSSVGGKTGVNLPAGKNLVGAFWQPRLVLCDLATLRTLPDREFRSGLAEVIKYGVISDAALFRLLERQMPRVRKRDAKVLAHVVARCCAIKADVVSQDETESDLRAILNFGHTIGHAIEAVSGYGRWLHGEAIAVGMTLAARLSQALLGLPPDEAGRLTALLCAAGLPVAARWNTAQQRRLIEAMLRDKKVRAGEIRFVLARHLGAVEHGHPVPLTLLQGVLAAAQGGHTTSA